MNSQQDTHVASNPAPQPFPKMSRRSKRRQRQRMRRAEAAAEYEEMCKTAVTAQCAPGVTVDGKTIGLQYGEDDPAGFSTIEDGYIPLEDFPLFPKLPLELRRMIWRRNLPEPQSIYVHSNGHTQKITIGNITQSHWKYRAAASYKVPHLLSVNKEARAEVKLLHPPCFAPNFGGVPIYYNRKNDLLHFDSPEALLHFYGGSAPNHVPRSLTGGYRLNMSELHNFVSQIAVGNVRAHEGMLGGMLNQMKGLKAVLLEDKLCRPEGKEIIEEYCHGIKNLELGWEEYTIDRKIDNKAIIKLVPFAEFKENVLGWKTTQRLVTKEEEDAAKAEAAEAALIRRAQQLEPVSRTVAVNLAVSTSADRPRT